MFASSRLAPSTLRPANAILAALPAAEYALLAAQLRPLKLNLGDILYQPGEVADRVYFVNSGVLSCVLISDDGVEVEVGLIGREGVACTLAALTGGQVAAQIIVQGSGEAVFLSAEQLRAAFARGGDFQLRILQNAQFSSEQTSQTALCNRLHSIEERLARWLLMMHDRLQDDDLEMTQEFLATMLGSRRAGVTLAAGALKKAGLIKYSRGKVTLLDREGLEDTACECYDPLRERFNNALQP